jgi:hypothetical protein
MCVSLVLFVLLQRALNHHFHATPKTHHEYWWFVRHGGICVNITRLIQQSAYVISHGHWAPPSTSLRALKTADRAQCRCQQAVAVQEWVCGDLQMF